MAIPTYNAIGFCAHYSQQGDWAFDYALKLSEMSGFQLNVFHFLKDPYDPKDKGVENLNREQIETLAIEKEKKLRMYYDKRAGEYLKVGFRVCYDDSWTELHRCLIIREFQLLVLGYPEYGSTFAKIPIEEFAQKFISPVVLVGPEKSDQYWLNNSAMLLINKLELEQGNYKKLELATV